MRYNVLNWLEKNKDPLNDTAAAVLKSSPKNALLPVLWDDYQTQEEAVEAVKAGGKTMRKTRENSIKNRCSQEGQVGLDDDCVAEVPRVAQQPHDYVAGRSQNTFKTFTEILGDASALCALHYSKREETVGSARRAFGHPSAHVQWRA